jgi:PAS domain S-box-containing protein
MISVLYVDDEEILLEVAKMYMERTGEISIDTATSALLALKKLDQATYDVIVSDYQMPDMDGIAFLKKLRSEDNPIPFIIFTGRGREEIVIEAINNGADFYLQKGGEPKSQFAELQSKIQQATLRKRAEHELAQRNDELNAANKQLSAATEELRQNYDELGRSEKKYRSVIENIHAAVVVHNPDTSIRLINETALDLLGLPHDEAIGRAALHPSWHFLHENGNILLPADYPVNQVFATQKPLRNMLVGIFRPKSQDTVWVLVNADPEYDQNGTITAVIVTFTDITEPRQAEEELRERERFLTTLISNLPGFAYRCKNDANWTMVFVSGACTTLTGYKPDDLIDNRTVSFASLIVPEDRQRVDARVQQGVSTLLPFQMEYRITDRTNRIRWVWEQGRGIFNASGDLTFIEGYIADISERKYAEEALQQANRKLNLLSGITRHDIMNQLQVLQAYIQICENKIDTPDQLAELFLKEKKIARNIEHQINFTRDYQDLGVQMPVWQNVNTIIDHIVATLPMKEIQVHIDRKDLEIYADRLLEKTFYNLIDNALRYGGEAMTAIRISSCEENGLLVIAIADDGTGIGAEYRSQLFTKGFGKNTGLGLFLSREILSITGITITENGEPGKGARFEMTVPNGEYRFSHT